MRASVNNCVIYDFIYLQFFMWVWLIHSIRELNHNMVRARINRMHGTQKTGRQNQYLDKKLLPSRFSLQWILRKLILLLGGIHADIFEQNSRGFLNYQLQLCKKSKQKRSTQEIFFNSK